MSYRTWMPLYIGDYVRDTAHLGALESGAYLHLIMAYWLSGSLPNDDRQLATIAKMNRTEWRRTGPILAKFFGPNWSSHKRIDAELALAKVRHDARAAAGKRGGIAAAKAKQEGQQNSSNATSNALAKPYQSHLERKKDAADAALQGNVLPLLDPDADLFRRGKEVLGEDAGGLIARLKKIKGTVPLARAAIEMAASKQNPREYIGRIVAGQSDEPGHIPGIT